MSQVVEFVTYVLQQICENTESISVKETEDDRGTLIEVSVAESDMGRVIGKEGMTISALRTLVQSMGMRDHKKVFLKILDS